MPLLGGVSSRLQNLIEILRNGNLTSRVAPRVAQVLDDGEMDNSDNEINEDELQDQEASCLDAVLLDIVVEINANSVEDDPFHTDNLIEENIEDHSGRALRPGKHVPKVQHQDVATLVRVPRICPKETPPWVSSWSCSSRMLFC